MYIWLIEDNEADVRLVREVLVQNELTHWELRVINNGRQAAEALAEPELRRPDIVLLDLHLPGKNGLEVLAQLRATQGWQHTPVFVFSTSTLESDMRAAYQLGANAYMIKPMDIFEFEERLMGAIRFICHFICDPEAFQFRSRIAAA
jgi:two-component system response regulator